MSFKPGKSLNTKSVASGRGRKKSSKALDLISGSYGSESHNKLMVFKTKPGSSCYTAMPGGSADKETVLSKIIQNLKSTYLMGEDSIYSFQELLNIAKIPVVSENVKEWLVTALLTTERVKYAKFLDGIVRYSYNPPLLDCTSKSKLLEFLKKHREEASGGVLEEDIIASVPYGERVLSSLRDQLCSFERQDKKRVFFYESPEEKDKPEWMKELVKEASVYSYNDEKIEDYLRQHEIKPLKDRISEGAAKSRGETKRNQRRRKLPQRSCMKDNAHVEGLETYDEFM